MLDISVNPSDTEPAAVQAATDWEVAAVEWEGVGERPDDWQCPLPPLADYNIDDSAGNWPLTSLLNALASTDAPALVQVIITPRPDWTATKEYRILDLERNSDLRRHALGQSLFGSTGTATTGESPQSTEQPTHTDPSVAPSNARRIDGLRTVDARRSFTVNARAVALDTDATTADRTIQSVASGFQSIRGDQYRVTPTQYAAGTDGAHDRLTALCDRAIKASPTRRRTPYPGDGKRQPGHRCRAGRSRLVLCRRWSRTRPRGEPGARTDASGPGSNSRPQHDRRPPASPDRRPPTAGLTGLFPDCSRSVVADCSPGSERH